MSVPVTPVKPEDFTGEWCLAVMKNWFRKNDINVETVKVGRVEARLNSQQVSLVGSGWVGEGITPLTAITDHPTKNLPNTPKSYPNSTFNTRIL